MLNFFQLILRIVSKFTSNIIYKDLRVAKIFPKIEFKIKLTYKNYFLI